MEEKKCDPMRFTVDIFQWFFSSATASIDVCSMQGMIIDMKLDPGLDPLPNPTGLSKVACISFGEACS